MARFYIENDVLHAEGLVPGSIDDAIAKWQFLVDEKFHGNCRSRRTCSLCLEYNKDHSSPMCGGCPVNVYTGDAGCDGTPFVEWASVHALVESIGANGEATDTLIDQLAQQELDFLIFLRDDMSGRIEMPSREQALDLLISEDAPSTPITPTA